MTDVRTVAVGTQLSETDRCAYTLKLFAAAIAARTAAILALDSVERGVVGGVGTVARGACWSLWSFKLSFQCQCSNSNTRLLKCNAEVVVGNLALCASEGGAPDQYYALGSTFVWGSLRASGIKQLPNPLATVDFVHPVKLSEAYNRAELNATFERHYATARQGPGGEWACQADGSYFQAAGKA
jgi:hypothetical protein